MGTTQQPTAQISLHCKAGEDAVYDLVADLRTHAVWAGVRQSRNFRLLTLDVPPGPATVGTTFSSTGNMPMTPKRWHDMSRVTEADRPRVFELTTDSTVAGRRTMTARYHQRYEFSPEAGGSRLTYTLTQLAMANPMLRFGLPGIRRLSWRMSIMLATRGIRNLVTLAEEGVLPAEADTQPLAGRAVNERKS
jgi:hypothetical protein